MANETTTVGAGVYASNPRGDVGSIDRFFFSFMEEARQFVIRDIRYFFATHPRVADHFRFVGLVDPAVENPLLQGETDVQQSKLRIAAGYSDREQLYPSILVHKISASINDLWLGQKMGSLVAEAYDTVNGRAYDREVGERRGGKLTLTVGVRVVTVGGGPEELDQVSDALLYGFVVPIRQRLEKRGLIWVPNSGSFSQESEEPYDNTQKKFARNLSFQLLAEWYDDFIFDGVEASGAFEFVSGFR